MPRPRAPRQLLVALSTLAVAVLLYPGALLRGEAFFERDLHLDWYPHHAALSRALAEGAWPLWEPGLGFGQPLLADPSVQVLYPATWLVLMLPVGVAYTGYVLVHLLVAGLGAARLGARLGAGRAGAWTAGLAFVLSGPLQSALNLWHHFAGASWMPWVLLAVDTLVRRPSAGSLLALAAALALQILAGSADLCAMTLALAVVLAAVRLAPTPRPRVAGRRRALLALTAALALAAALSCALWWPAAGLVSRSPRRSLPEDVRGAWSVPLAGLARLVAPLDPARVPFEAGLWTRLYDRAEHPLLYSLYLGLPMLGLASGAFLGRARRGRALAVAAVALAAVVFAMGPHGPIYGPLAEIVPGVRVFRYPSKALLVVSLAVALLAGLGVRALRRAAGARLAVAAAVAVASGALALLASRLHADPGWSSLMGLAFALVLSLQGVRLRAGLAAGLLAAIALADLAAAHRELNKTAASALLVDPPPVLEKLRGLEGRRLHVWDYHTLPGTAERLLGRPSAYSTAAPVAGIEPRVLEFAAQRQLLVPQTATFFGLETSYDLDNRGLYPRDLNDLCYFLPHVAGTPVELRLLQLGAVAKVVTLHDSALEALRLEATLPSLVGDAIRVYAVPDPLPRAWLVGRTRVADEGAAFQALVDPAFDPHVEALVASGTPLNEASPLQGSVRWLERRSDRQRLEVTCSRSALLVLADAYDPGWRVSVDGDGSTLQRANVAFRGVAVPRGRHVVELVYRPRAVALGLGVSLAALVTAAALFASSRRRSRAPTAG